MCASRMETGMAEKKRPPRKKRPRGSSTGRVVNVPADQTNWRQNLQQARIKFDDVQKDIYLMELADHGLKGRSGRSAGVCMQTIQDHREIDPEFQMSEQEAMSKYRDKVVAHANDLALNGVKTVRIIDERERVEKIEYPIRLIELELKRVEPEYREKQPMDINPVGTGVLLAPADKSPQQWIDEQMKLNETRVKPDSSKLIEHKKD